MHTRTSLDARPRTAERLTTAAAVVAAGHRPQAIELRPSAAKAATSERPVRVEVGTSQHVVMGRLGRRVGEFEPWRLPRTSTRRKGWPMLLMLAEELEVELVREKSRTSAP